MNKIFTLVLSVLLCMVGSAASAQNVSTPDSLNAYYRLSNPDLNQYMTAFTEGGIGVTSANPSNASQVFRLSTSKLYNISADLADLRSRLDKGNLTQLPTTLFPNKSSPSTFGKTDPIQLRNFVLRVQITPCSSPG